MSTSHSCGDRSAIAARVLSPDDQSLSAFGLRGLTISHPEWIRTSRMRGTLRGRWLAHDVQERQIGNAPAVRRAATFQEGHPLTAQAPTKLEEEP